ncbi:MAG: 4'-phosphopantetheinyl transferase superfamily protein [Desulfobacteraceae bacterium]|nr:4'-phosphopantetheinyl transferase superfamily protein [Desulfobacteraceae bacterium]
MADFKPRDRVKFLSRHARLALKLSAQKSDLPLGELNQDENGAPLPFNNVYWSITHKTHYVGGVVAPAPIGIDIERIRECAPGLFARTAGDREWALADPDKDSLLTFFRYWTSKEALVKTSGSGLRDLLKCQVTRIIDERHLQIRYSGREWLIEHFYFDQHIASITQDAYQIEWTLE